jgi:F-type H+-transporting ATPase subunit delta
MLKSSSFYRVIRYYTKAFLNVFQDSIRETDYEHIAKAADVLSKNHRLINLLQISFLRHHEIKKTVIKKIIDDAHLPLCIEKLALLLIEAERIHLLPSILKEIIILHNKKKNIMHMRITTSHLLTPEHHTHIKDVLGTMCKNSIKGNIEVDPTLIAGIRAQSETILWESSIRKTLKVINAQFEK